MCKVLAFTNLGRVKHLSKLVEVAAPIVCRRDDDGFGWAALGQDGVFGERSLDASDHKYRIDKLDQVVKNITKPTTNTFGHVSKLIGGGMFHGRTSTNDASLLNTHPIRKSGWTLIHNGVVSNTGPKYEMRTTNDTEHLVQYMSTTGISGVEKHLTGYYAFAAFAPNGHMHVVRDSIAPLYVAYSKQIDSYVFATTKEIILDVFAEMKWKHGPIDPVLDNVHVVYEVNNIVSQNHITSLGYGQREQSLMHLSLGKDSKMLPIVQDVGGGDSLWRDLNTQDVVTEADLQGTRDDYDGFLDECLSVDGSYEIYDKDDIQIDAREFHDLNTTEKLECYIVRPDGTVMSPINFKEPKLGA